MQGNYDGYQLSNGFLARLTADNMGRVTGYMQGIGEGNYTTVSGQQMADQAGPDLTGVILRTEFGEMVTVNKKMLVLPFEMEGTLGTSPSRNPRAASEQSSVATTLLPPQAEPSPVRNTPLSKAEIGRAEAMSGHSRLTSESASALEEAIISAAKNLGLDVDGQVADGKFDLRLIEQVKGELGRATNSSVQVGANANGNITPELKDTLTITPAFLKALQQYRENDGEKKLNLECANASICDIKYGVTVSRATEQHTKRIL